MDNLHLTQNFDEIFRKKISDAIEEAHKECLSLKINDYDNSRIQWLYGVQKGHLQTFAYSNSVTIKPTSGKITRNDILFKIST